ncbi:MAG TPA: bifunctional methylenetetrahydrofolate dehydrogenase/methenyltetrahydrofolate cyclohydrolase FolD [Geminicoccus sp.]|jgi:methylenetetrahydrofolate dehydrogenase (NADP+)/methenyltetrahydrofolate cyclohydrolase|uniref:bifunctional methylenetetrahydrofolate dehydrogenase/methenyltetrahydrofolate cyclohydrolase FolD n=1 Tax=Geminicoccus sp. TaxID=2024832 RepID=UPI002E2F05C8|nr:bifunctional methylenetetrahydrofolate dehydrogenase/methenyltetrahydrofolate cyclohydrolase FolD [Geminicoccus sp.]HEX2526546.1 bifunctional methylenetetrahydrofolate dehydrogenase/methenyltetrahydrofolate cyclohydrolase FolD [Geminicoccus sp.]
MTRIIDGKAAAQNLRARIGREVDAFVRGGGPMPGLAVVLVGRHPASLAYVSTKTKMAEEVGMSGQLLELPEQTSTTDLLATIDRLNKDAAVHGILVQLPLPDQIDAGRVLNAIRPDKDVDGFHPVNVGRLFSASGDLPDDLLVPCTPKGCMILLRDALDDLRGRRAVVVGRSNIVGKPVAALLLAADCTVTIAHSRTRDLPALCRSAEILVAAVGRPEFIQGEWIGEGSVVVDVGINRVDGPDGKGRLVGDVAFAGAAERAAAITPVPGGVGPMTVACLLDNTLIAARAQAATG